MEELNKLMEDYLMGNDADVELMRKTLGGQGHELIIPICTTTLPVIGRRGVFLAAVIKQSEQLAAKIGPEEAGRQNYQAEMDAGRPIDQVFLRTQGLIERIVNAGDAQKAGKEIEYVLLGPDPRYCAVAAIHAATKSIPPDPVLGALCRVYSEEIPFLLKVAVASGLLDGRPQDYFGPHPLGQVIFGPDGHFSNILLRGDLAKFAQNNRLLGTPEENTAVVKGSIAYFGTYSLTDDTLKMHITGSSFPNWTGTDQTRTVHLAGNQLIWENAAASGGGGGVKQVYERAK